MMFLYDKPRWIALLIVFLVMTGLFSYQLQPRLEDPVMPEIFAVVNTLFPGASSERVENLVTDKLEQHIAEVNGIKYIESTNRPGISTITICLKDEYINKLDHTWSEIRDKIEDTIPELPSSAKNPEFETVAMKSASLIIALSCDSNNGNYLLLQRLSKELENILRGVTGTGKVDFFGEPEEEIIVEPDPLKMISLNKTVTDIANQIHSSDAKVPRGFMRDNNNSFALEMDSELDSIMRIGNIPIVQGNSGHMVLLAEIAHIQKSIVQPMSTIAFTNGRPAIILAANAESKIRVDHWCLKVRHSLSKWQEQLPREVRLDIIFDQSQYVEQRLSQLQDNLLLGFMLVIIVTLLLMGWRSTLIMTLSFPLCILTVFALMRILDIPIHQMSIIGLIVALGMLIDASIITVHEMQQMINSGLEAKEAVKQTFTHLAIPLSCSTITTILAFMPIAIMPGPGGSFVYTIGLCVILSLLSSLILSLTIGLIITGWLYNWSRTYSAGFIHQGLSLVFLQKIYNWSLQQLLRWPILGLLVGAIFPIIGFYQAQSLEMRFFPPPDRNQLLIDIELPNDSSIELTKDIALNIDKVLAQNSEIINVHWFIGKSVPRFFNNLLSNRKNIPHYAQAFVELSSAQLGNSFFRALQDRLDVTFPQARIIVRQLNQGPPFEAPISLRLYGPDLQVLQEWGAKVRLECSKIGDITHTRSNLNETVSNLEISVSEELAHTLDLDNITIAEQLASLLEGTLGGSVIDNTEELPIRVRLSSDDRKNLQYVTSLQLLNKKHYIPLSVLATLKLTPQYANIQRRNRKRCCIIDGFIHTGIPPEKAFLQFEQRWQKLLPLLPSGYTWEFGGEEEQRQDTVSNLFSTIGILTILMIASIIISFNSFRLAAIIAIVAILTMGSALGSLWLFGYQLGFMSILGTMGLIGIAINDSIVVLAAIRQDPQACKGEKKAIQRIIFTATRHVLATTITTMVGFSPLLFDKTGMWPPLAIAIAGGITGGTLLALYFVPSAYILMTQNKLTSYFNPKEQ